MWPRRVYTRQKRAGHRLNLTPAPGLAFAAKTEGLPGGDGHPGRRASRLRPEPCHPAAGQKGSRQERGLRKIAEGDGSALASTRLGVAGTKGLQESSTGKETLDEKIATVRESMTNDFKTDTCSSYSELVSGLSLQRDSSSSLLSDSITESCAEHNSIAESISSFSSPELFRGSYYLDWECPKLEDYVPSKNSTLLDSSKAVAVEKAPRIANLSTILNWECPKLEDYVPSKNSTLLDSSKAVAVEKAPRIANLSTILSTSSDQKCHRKIEKIIEDQNSASKLKYTSNSASDNAAHKLVFTGKTCPLTTKSTKKKPEKDSEARDPSVRTKLNSSHLNVKVPLSLHRLTLENNAERSVTNTLLPQPPEPVLKNSSNIPEKKSKGLLTSTPSSETADFVIDLSAVKEASFGGLFPDVSNYVNSNEIVPVSSKQDNSSNELPSSTSEICCIIKLSPGTRQLKNNGDFVKKKNYSFPKDIPQDIITKTHDMT